MTPAGRDRLARRRRRWVPVLTALLLAASFASLGVWQLERRAWKLALIAQMDRRIHAVPSAPPGPDAWRTVSADRNAYQRVRIRGVFETGQDTLVQAVTEEGPGYWVMTPLRMDAGYDVLVNRGFLPTDLAAAETRAPPPSGPTTVTGLLRISEPHGGFLRANQPKAGRWYSRDVAAIARARGLPNAAPYFIDAAATLNPGGWPHGGLTVVNLSNNHLSYALVWFALAAMSGGWGGWAVSDRRRCTSVRRV